MICVAVYLKKADIMLKEGIVATFVCYYGIKSPSGNLR